MHFRVSAPERERYRAWAKNLGLTQNALFHALIQLDEIQDGTGAIRCVILDSKTMRSMANELKRWGYHFNQTNHALNALNYYLSLEEAGIVDIEECLRDTEDRLRILEGGVDDMRYRFSDLSNMPILRA